MACTAVAPAVAQPVSAVAGQPAFTDDSSFLTNGVTAHRGFPETYANITFPGYTAAMAHGSPNPIRNGLLQSDAKLTARGHGHLKGAVALDGTGDYVDVPFEVLPEESPAYTASVWFKPEQVGTRQPLLESSGSGAISMELAETGNLKYSIQSDGTSLPKASKYSARSRTTKARIPDNPGIPVI